VANRTVSVRLLAEVAGYVRGLKTAHGATRDFVGELDKAARAGKLDAVADQAARVGLGLTGLAVGAVAMAARFDKAMSSVKAATHASGVEMETLRAAAIQAGKDTAYSATEAAQGIEELAKAGVSTQDIIGGGLSGALSLAAAGEIDVSEAAETAASTLTQFGLKGKDVSHVADLLAAAAGKAQGGVHDMSQALQQSGLVASQMGLSVEETTGALAAFASAGLLGSDAGTSFKTMLQRLVAPSGQAAALMDELGISAFDAQGKFVGMAKFAGILHDALANMTDQQRNATLATIFGSDAIRAAAIVYQQGEKGVQGWIDKVDDTGYAAETAQDKTDNLIGDLERLKGELETLAIQSGSSANSGLRVLAQFAEKLVAEFGSLPPVVGGTITVLSGLSGILLLGASGWIRMRRSKTGPVGARAATGLQRVSRWAGRAAVAFAAYEIASAALSVVQKDLNIQVDALGKGLADWGRSGRLAGESARVLGKDMEDLHVGLKFLADTDNDRRQFARWGEDLLEKVVPGLDGTNTSLTKTRERVEAMDQALAGLVQGGQADAAEEAFQRLAASVAADGVSIEELRKMFPAYAGAVETAGGATDTAAGQITNAGSAAANADNKVKDLTQAFDELYGASLKWSRSEVAAEAALDDLADSLDENGKALTRNGKAFNLNTGAGRANESAMLDVIEAARDAAQAKYEESGSVQAATNVYGGYIDRLKKTMHNAGLTATQIRILLGEYAKMPPSITTDIEADTRPATRATQGYIDKYGHTTFNFPIRANTAPAYSAISGLERRIRRLDGTTVTIRTRFTSSGEYIPGQGTSVRNRWGGLYEHAQSGLLREAAIYSPDTPARYAFAEPATGGEAFIPMRGDIERSRAIWEHVGRNWLGMLPRGGDGAGAAAPVYNNTQSINLYGSEATVERLSAWQREQAIRERVGRPR
jgi:TP901 family phage tail tape measure protein